jgi:putative transposase
MLGLFRRRRLPHWDVPDASYFVTTCLHGSIPACGLTALEDFRRSLDARARPSPMTEADWEHHKNKLIFAKLDEWLDDKPTVRHLEQPMVAAAVRSAIFHFAEVRYHLLAYVVRPSHLHWVFHPLPNWSDSIGGAGFQPAKNEAGRRPAPRTPREIVMHSLKSYTAHECNRLLGRRGEFWQDESYDHWVRDEDELFRIIEYIESNPVKAGLCKSATEFLYSSAHDRDLWGIRQGEPLIPPSQGGERKTSAPTL